MNNYIRALAIANSSETGSWGQITGTFMVPPVSGVVVWATKTGGTTNLAEANYLNLTNGLSGNQIRLNVDDCNTCSAVQVAYCVRGGTPVIATGGWESKSRTEEIAVGLYMEDAWNDFGTISIQERSNNGDVQYYIKFDVTGI
jgi:hypothetical protein